MLNIAVFACLYLLSVNAADPFAEDKDAGGGAGGYGGPFGGGDAGGYRGSPAARSRDVNPTRYNPSQYNPDSRRGGQYNPPSRNSGQYSPESRNSGQYNPDPRNAVYPPVPYSFNYVAPAIGGSSSRTESGDGSGTVTGSYTINYEDGQFRIVNYVADANGFRAEIETNEQGTLTSNAADAIYRSNAPATVYSPGRSGYSPAASIPNRSSFSPASSAPVRSSYLPSASSAVPYRYGGAPSAGFNQYGASAGIRGVNAGIRGASRSSGWYGGAPSAGFNQYGASAGIRGVNAGIRGASRSSGW